MKYLPKKMEGISKRDQHLCRFGPQYFFYGFLHSHAKYFFYFFINLILNLFPFFCPFGQITIIIILIQKYI